MLTSSRIHDDDHPPDEHYDELLGSLKQTFPKAEADLVEHVVALAAAFDTAIYFALSFGIAKFQFAHTQVNLVGEYFGRDGLRPNSS